jgi:GNAT superfamily N-acetyltransferase
MVTYKIATKQDIKELAKLRIEVFYDFPYLYEGSFEYEQKYLETYTKGDAARVFLAIVKGEIVGATSCIPLTLEPDEVKVPVSQATYNPNEVLYFGESVLKKDYRGLGIGVKFFELREQYARELGMKYCAFCGVVRPDNHPLKPQAYVPLNHFWAKRGYAQIPQCIAYFSWLDRGEKDQTKKPLQFWIKKLT